MKILFINSLWGPFGGKEQYFKICVEQLQRLGHQCVVAYGRISSKPGESSMPAVREYEIPTLTNVASADDEHGARQLSAILAQEAPDVIYMCDVRNLRMLAALNDYGGLVNIFHDYWLVCRRGTCTTPISGAICHRKCAYCHLRHSFTRQRAVLAAYKAIPIHLVGSSYMKSRLLQDGFRASQVCVASLFTELYPQSDATAPDGIPAITFVGRIERTKGVGYLLRALAMLSTPFRCSIIGDGAYLPFCKELSRKLGLTECVDFTGWLPQDRITERLAASSMLVVPSIWPEPFGLVGLEAMACSKPVVAFDVGGISEWLRDGTNGYLVPARRSDLMAEKIQALLGDRQHALDLGADGLRLLKTEFNKEKHFERLLSAFEVAADTRRRSVARNSSIPLMGQPGGPTTMEAVR